MVANLTMQICKFDWDKVQNKCHLQRTFFHWFCFCWINLICFVFEGKKKPKTKQNKRGFSEKVYFRSQILERPSIGKYWNILCVPVLSGNVTFTFFRTCWLHPEANNTGMQKWSSIVQYLCTSIWDLKYTFSGFSSSITAKFR